MKHVKHKTYVWGTEDTFDRAKLAFKFAKISCIQLSYRLHFFGSFSKTKI